MRFSPASRAVVSSVPVAMTTRYTRLGPPRSLPAKHCRTYALFASPRLAGIRASLLRAWTPWALASRTNRAT